jgi:hypothetical protein
LYFNKINYIHIYLFICSSVILWLDSGHAISKDWILSWGCWRKRS